MKRPTLTVLATAIVLSVCQAHAQEAWSDFRGPERTGVSSEAGLLKAWPEGGPGLKWKVDGLGIGFSSAAVTDDTVYVTGVRDGQLVLFAFGTDGEKKWEKAHGKGWVDKNPAWSGSRAAPVVKGGRLYLLSGPGVLACYDPTDGTEVWRREMSEFNGRIGRWGYSETPLVLDDKIIVSPGGENCVVALKPDTGETIWTSKASGGKAEYSSCIHAEHDGVPMIIGASRNGLFGISPADGKVLWTNNFAANNTANCPTPLYVDGYVFWAVGYGKGGVCLKLSAEGGNVTAGEAWRTGKMNCHHGGYVILDGFIYGNHGGGWACLELASGDERWYERGVGKGSVISADGLLFTFSENGGTMGLAIATPDGYKKTGRAKVQGRGKSWAHPALANGSLYVRYADNLYCFDVAE